MDSITSRALEAIGYAAVAAAFSPDASREFTEADVRECAITLGLAQEVLMQGPCGESCACAWAGVEFPAKCRVLRDDLKKMMEMTGK